MISAKHKRHVGQPSASVTLDATPVMSHSGTAQRLRGRC